MLFPTVAFALFFCVAFLANWLLRPHPTAWRLTMIGLSFFFYGFWDGRFVALLGASIAINHLAALWVTSATGRHRRVALAAGVGANLGVLGFFKYYGFFVTSVANGLGRLGVETTPPLLDIILPIGISFFTFQAISYLVDLNRGELDQPLRFLDLGFYLSFFPQLVAGPIVRATDLAPQIRQRPDPRTIPAGEAFWLIAQGLIKKVVISSYLATNLVDPVFDVPGDHSRLDVLLAIYGYSVQIYADFSGYTDIAIGCALLLGFRFPQNFDSPFRALSIRDFWRRWHISLSTWLRDYVYIPFGGNRGGRIRTARNLGLTMVLGGLWHGAAWTFLVWGAIHGAALIVERLLTGVLRRRMADPTAPLLRSRVGARRPVVRDVQPRRSGLGVLPSRLGRERARAARAPGGRRRPVAARVGAGHRGDRRCGGDPTPTPARRAPAPRARPSCAGRPDGCAGVRPDRDRRLRDPTVSHRSSTSSSESPPPDRCHDASANATDQP